MRQIESCFTSAVCLFIFLQQERIVMLLINGITGAIGTSLLQNLTNSAEIVAGVGRNPEKIDLMKRDFPLSHFKVLSDIQSETEAKRILSEIQEESGHRITQYLHAAAIMNRTQSPLTTTVQDFKETIETNLIGAFVWNKSVVSTMIDNGEPGVVLNIASQAARTGGFGGATSYAASKGGLVTLTKSFARFAADYKIRVNCISPGFIDNEMMTSGLGKEDINMFIQKTALKRLASNEEIANVCQFLLGDTSSYITGENFEVSAGQILG